MHIYNNLNDEVKRVFRYRVAYIFASFVWSVYCVVALFVYNNMSPFLIGIVTINLIMIVNSFIIIWVLIDTNDDTFMESSPERCSFTQLMDIVVGGSLTTVIILIYCVSLSHGKFVIFEFVGMLPYIIVHSCVCIYVIAQALILFLQYIHTKIIFTKCTVDERQRLITANVQK